MARTYEFIVVLTRELSRHKTEAEALRASARIVLRKGDKVVTVRI